MRTAVVKRQYLLKLKAKYAGNNCLMHTCMHALIHFHTVCVHAHVSIHVHNHADGQRIAKRLSTSIGRETTTARKLLKEYNDVSSMVLHSHVLTEVEILSPDSKFWQPTQTSSTDLLWTIKKNVISAYMLMKHAEEELCLIGDDMQNMALYWQHREDIITRHIHTMDVENGQLAKGLVSLLYKLLRTVEMHQLQVTTALSKMNVDAEVSSSACDSDLSSDSDSDIGDSDLEDESFCLL